MNHYKHLTTDERENARVLLAQGFSIRSIASVLQRSPSTISREFKRNSKKNGDYVAHYAQKLYDRRKINSGTKPILLDETIKAYVLERLEWRWTPEQIAGRSKLENKPFSLSYVTIYRAIDSGVLPKQLKKIMRFKWKYKNKNRSNDKRGKIQNTVSIHDRPVGANDRSELGHWESDTVIGRRKTGCLGTHVERKTGFLVSFYLPDRKDKIFNDATFCAFEKLPLALKKTFTVDNGIEFTHHIELSKATGMSLYFCDPYSPWQRGTNENTNGLLRQFFPKGTSFSGITADALKIVVDLINNRPRKRFGFRTPCEMCNLFLYGCCT